jgi:hypothetical protein
MCWQIEAALFRHLLHQVPAAGGQHRRPLSAQFPYFREPRILSVNLGAQSLGHTVEVGEISDRRPHPRGKDLIVTAFRKHAGQMKKVFTELSPEELRTLEVVLNRTFAIGGFGNAKALYFQRRSP